MECTRKGPCGLASPSFSNKSGTQGAGDLDAPLGCLPGRYEALGSVLSDPQTGGGGAHL